MFKRFLAKNTIALSVSATLLIAQQTHAQVVESRVNFSAEPASQADIVKAKVLIIDDIICSGNKDTDCEFILKKYYQTIGDVLDPNEVADAQLRLGTLFQLTDTNVYLEKGEQRDHVIVVFAVQEANNIQYEVSSGFQFSDFNENDYVYDCIGYSADYQRHYYQESPTGITDTRQIDSEYKDCDTQADLSSFYVTSKVTDFNFLGTGKELSFFLSYNDFERDVDSRVNTLTTNEYYSSDNYTFEQSTESYSNSHSQQHDTKVIGLRYFDPHLFGSAHYYLDSSLNYYSVETDVGADPDNNNLTAFDIALGYRFGRHSYFTLATSQLIGYEIPSDGTDYFNVPDRYSFSYGWNTENDALFPSQGEDFSVKAIFNRDIPESDSDELVVSYQKHTGLSADNIITLGAQTSLKQQDVFDKDNADKSALAEVSLRFSRNNIISKVSGVYSHWFIGVNLGVIYQDDVDVSSYQTRISEYIHEDNSKTITNDTTGRHYFRDNEANYFAGLQAGYTYQTQSVIYRFTLGYNQQDFD
ncbi:hypothetical protein RI844_03270 [Thalassotalea fonticola]|uniref:Uncharacterized protein n=1 Tax=Thalassotalea fonticola TaxID=3065649 RepID=A0ABZ0GS95_9GAMM|nr:hypothetical protein RI844_03270 [Colwelliaceae bacterium S1-1]